MNKVKLSWDKVSLVTVLSATFMVFGIGFIFWATFNIWSQSNNIVKATPTHYSAPETSPNKPLYPVYPVDGDNIGSLTIPALKLKLPLIQGTGVNDLKKGVGHFTQSVLPGEKDNCVLSGHRDTVFSKMGNLKIGDQLIVQTSAGIFTYKVNGTRIVHKDDKTVIVPTKNAVLTLTTCYPFNFIGNAPDRYIVSADLIKNK
ncbi:class D sortase [Clostridium lacusfryxellense]|uniref:class D sortase n=1 Tax=Clostridium lacusfryxellense TaxID=205328 RepID=UPI001C0D9F0E|nr:class D sortase [Clostridium lacusfryxellense]MBU3110998.1 class D sortase [Clostridium lacusfryxellense]